MNNTKSQETAKHTPTPWHINGTRVLYQKNAGGYRFDIAEVFRDVGSQCADANAQFIVKAVNCHDDLLEACKAVLTRQDWPVGTMKIKAQLQAAIEKASTQ